MILDPSTGVSGSSGGVKTTGSSFRAKVTQMKNWKPNNTPSNRDKLELYALHKQAVSNDAPPPPQHQPQKSSPAERAKLTAWRSKRGISQSQAMTGYILEADRQLLSYGTASSAVQLQQPQTSSPTTTPRNTPDERRKHHTGKDGDSFGYGSHQSSASLLLTPRGLAAVPLLCAAASETRCAYLERLGSNGNSVSTGTFSEGWWRKQEPLCGEPGTILALPETAVIVIATALESFSLSLNGINNTSSTRRMRKKPNTTTNTNTNSTTVSKDCPAASTTTLTTTLLPPNLLPKLTIRSFLWPLHNTLLVVWMLLIFLSTATGTAVIAARTMLLGKTTTGTSLAEILTQEIRPLGTGLKDLCGVHQSVGVRLLGLALYPMGLVCELSGEFRERCGGMGERFGACAAVGVYVAAVGVLWWYWLVVLPWMAMVGLMVSVGLGWCFGLIELASGLGDRCGV